MVVSERGDVRAGFFSQVVSPELATHFVNRLCAGETIEFPNLYGLGEVQTKFGGSWRD
jgi:hypothetical protein